MSLLKKILLYNSPSNVVERLREMNAKQRFLFADVIIMLFATIFFYNASDIFDKGMNVVLALVCFAFGLISLVSIYFFKTK